MKRKNHYETLGVKRTEDEGGIKAAFRQLAKRHHPDLSGAEETRHFQDILEAYTVLSDPELRASYNETLRRRGDLVRKGAGDKRTASSPQSGGVRSPHSSIFSRRGRDPASWFEALFDLFAEESEERIPGSRSPHRARILAVDVELSREEAERGGTLPLWHPALARCRFCGSLGLTDRLDCPTCQGQGVADHNDAIAVRIPAGIADGSVLEVAVSDPGHSGVVLRIHIQLRGR